MKNSIFPDKTSFQYLPQDLLALIFEFASLLDFSNLALVSKDFYILLKRKPELWAKHLFRDFLQINPKDPHFCDEYLFPHVLPVGKEKIKYGEMTDSRELLMDHYHIRKKWKAYFRMFMDAATCNNFLNDVFNALKKPGCPPPCLKKDIHHFPTNSIFQNFLTEVHFGIQGRSFFQDKKQSLIDDLVERVEEYYWSTNGDKEDLIRFRWYITEKSPQSKAFLDKLRMLSPRSKLISKKRLSIQLKESYICCKKRKRSRLGISMYKLRNRNKKTRKMYVLANRNIKPRAATRKNTKNYDNDDDDYSLGGNNIKKGSVVEFYNVLKVLTQNFCKMAFMYLKLVRDPYSLLSEYTRLWNRFALLVVDLNQTFTSLAGLVNKFYNDDFPELPNFPEFSTWRVMVRIWNEQVFSNLQYYLSECFRAIFLEIRCQEKSSSLKSIDAYKCPHCLTNESDLPNISQNFFYKFRKYNDKTQSKEDIIKLLKVFYHAVSDVSYNEYTIFYWDCANIRKCSPKGILDDFIIRDTTELYEYYKDCLLYDLGHLKDFIQSDKIIVEGVLGKSFHPQFGHLQTTIVQEILQEKIVRVLDEVERHSLSGANGLGEVSNRSNGLLEVNVKEAFRVLNIKEEIQKRISKNEEKKRKVIQTLLRDFKLFNTYVHYVKGEQENLEIYSRGLDEIKDHRFLRGFSIVEEKFDKLFDLGKEITLQEIKRIGLDGRDLKEKLESLDDRLVFI